MKNLQTLRLSASSIGSARHFQGRPTPTEAPAEAPTPEPAPSVSAPRAPRAPRPSAAALKKQMLLLLVVEAAATLAAVAATGDVHNTIFKIASVAIALTVALVVAIEAAASLRRARPAGSPAAAAATRPPVRSLTKTKIALLLVMAFGFATYFGGGGAFGTFTAEDTNANSNIASGTLTMNDAVNNRTTATACFSYNGAASNNVNQNCDQIFTLAGTGTPGSAGGGTSNPTGAGNLGPGAFGAVAKVVISNAGSIDASSLSLVAPYVNGTLHTNAIPTGNFTSITINNLEGTITSGDRLTISYGSQTLTVKASSTYSPVSPITNDVTVNVTADPSGTANNGTGATIPVGASVVDVDSDKVSPILSTDCYDQKATTNQVSGATVGNTLTFNTGASTNSLCNTALLYIQEVGTNSNYCWFGVIDGASNAAANGMCAAPISTTSSNLPATIPAGGGTYTVTALTGNVKSGDHVNFTQGNNVVQCVATANAFMGDTSISVNTCAVSSGSNGSFTTSSVITDPDTLTTLNPGSAANTIAGFDTSKSGTSGVPLYPVTSNGANAPAAPVALGKYGSANASRTFYVGVYLPTANGGNQNTIQGLMSTFGITWHINS